MINISNDLLQTYRLQTFHSQPGKRLSSIEEAVAFVNERSFIFFWPITGIQLPSLWVAVAGDRPVADDHDDPGHKTWGWKDQLLGQRQWYYAKVLRKKATMISFDAVPYFYALSENYGAPADDYLTQYEQGRLPLEAKILYEALLFEGPLDTIALKRMTRMSSQASESRFNRALTLLQADFKVIPVGVTQAGAWHYAFAYDIVARHYPDIPDNAQFIREDEARCELVLRYIDTLGAVQVKDIIRLFQWKANEVQRAVEVLVDRGQLLVDVCLDGQPGDWFVTPKLV